MTTLFKIAAICLLWTVGLPLVPVLMMLSGDEDEE